VTTSSVVGWTLLATGIFFLLRAARLDRRLQQFRAPGVTAAAYLGYVGRWRQDLYTLEGRPLVWPTRLAFALFCVTSLLGALVLENATF
jgi:hypothetical protein